MISPLQILSLPASLLLLIASARAQVSSNELRWPYSLPPHVKYFPEDERLVRRDENIQQSLRNGPPAAVKKMGCDEGEKFFLDYWALAPSVRELASNISKTLDDSSDSSSIILRSSASSDWANFSIVPQSLLPAFPLHSEQRPAPRLALLSRAFRFPFSSFDKRGFQCPAGTSACAAINRPDSCCALGETCQVIQDTGLGDVGCCSQGQVCQGQLTACIPGYTSCPNNPGGGCCIPGYACFDIGCAISSTATVVATVEPPAASSSSSLFYSSSALPPATSTATSIVVVPAPIPPDSTSPSPSPLATTSTPSTSTPSATTTTSTSTSSPPSSSTSSNIPCSPGFNSCPASLGGGCCPTTRACGSNSCPTLTSTVSLGAPVRPTSVSLTSTSTPESTIAGAGCPTGFYACSAYYPGGCCRVGRDCASTSCPASASTSLVDTAGVTVIAPTGNSVSANQGADTGTCATGWSTCAGSLGGGCCPTGYGCGTASCTATASGGKNSTVGKDAGSRGRQSFKAGRELVPVVVTVMAVTACALFV